jgi:RimJ/RimL family protein N-acetyltransferase
MAFPVEIHTPNLRVREFVEDDLTRFLHMSSDSDVVRYLAFGPTSEAEARGMVEFAIGSARVLPRTQYVLAIDNAAEGYLIGSCGLSISDDAPVEAEVYFVFRKEAWGHGFGEEVLRSLIDFSFDNLSLSRVFGQAHPYNRHSIATMESAGMAYDGAGQNPLSVEGTDDGQDGVRYAILNR